MSKRAEKAANEIYKDGIELLGRRDKNGNLIIHPETMIGILRNACQRGYDQAEKDIKEQMMKEAMEYEVMDFSSSLETHPHVNILLDNKKYRFGDKVRIIIVKDDEK